MTALLPVSGPDPASAFNQRGWLSVQPPAVRALVLRVGRIVRLENRETLTFEGDTDTRMYGIVAGFIGCHISHRHNQPVLGTLLGPGEWFGEGPMVDASTRHITYCAMQPAKVLALDAAGMAELRRTFADFDRCVAQLAVRQVRYLSEVAAELLIENATDRITAVLLRLCADHLAPVVLPVLQAELGEMSNASRNSVSKVLQILAQAGLVRRGYGGIEVPDPVALSRWYDDRVLRG